jgi:hypothetical protein
MTSAFAKQFTRMQSQSHCDFLNGWEARRAGRPLNPFWTRYQKEGWLPQRELHSQPVQLSGLPGWPDAYA